MRHREATQITKSYSGLIIRKYIMMATTNLDNANKCNYKMTKLTLNTVIVTVRRCRQQSTPITLQDISLWNAYIIISIFIIISWPIIGIRYEQYDVHESELFSSQVDSFVNHCDDNYLELNVLKTKEMVINFRQNRPGLQPVDIKGSLLGM